MWVKLWNNDSIPFYITHRSNFGYTEVFSFQIWTLLLKNLCLADNIKITQFEQQDSHILSVKYWKWYSRSLSHVKQSSC